jgi:hypothetical protein
MFASAPQLLASPIALPILVLVPIPVAAAVYVDASRSNLDPLRKSRNGRKKAAVAAMANAYL